MPQRDVSELLDAYIAQEKMHHMEGRKGVEHLCQIARALGYQDPMCWGHLSNKAVIGDLLAMLEDNSGMIEAMLEWVKSRNFSEFREPLEALVEPVDTAVDHYENGECPDCGEEIDPAAVKGDACDNCGHVFTWGEND